MKKFLLGMALAACFGAAGFADAYAPPSPVRYGSYGSDRGYYSSSSDYHRRGSNYISRRMTLHLSYKDADGLYEGDVDSNGIPNGRGRFTTTYTNDTDRWRYEGEFRNGHFEGYGRVTDLDASHAWREGPFRNDELTGYGKLGKNGNVIWEGYFLRDIPLERERPLSYPVKYSNWEFYISDIYADNYLGNVRANGRFVILKTKAKNLTNLYVRPIATPGLVRLWDRRNDEMYEVATDAMKRYYNDYGNSRWMSERMAPGDTDTVLLAFDLPNYVDTDDLTLVFYAGADTVGDTYTIDVR